MILITNDDGIDAPGIRALEEICHEDYIVIAPDREYSGCSHRVTAYSPITVRQIDEHHLAISGAPADCVRLGISTLCPDITAVWAGINHGGNLGADVYLSGTVAAVREAALLGCPFNVAFSQYRKRSEPTDWALAQRHALRALEWIRLQPAQKDKSFWNVNFPDLEPGHANPGIHLCPVSIDPLPVRYERNGDQYIYRGKYSERQRTKGTDVEICFNDEISVSLVKM